MIALSLYLVLLIGWALAKVVFCPSWVVVYLYFFGQFGGGCIGIVYLESLFWHIFLIDIFLPIKKKKKSIFLAHYVQIIEISVEEVIICLLIMC